MLSPSGTGECPKCEGSKHIENPNGTFRECDCLKEQRRLTAYKKSELLQEFRTMAWSEAEAANKKYATAIRGGLVASYGLKKRKLGKRFMTITGGSDYARLTVASLLLRDAINLDMSVACCQFNNLVDTPFDKDGRREVAGWLEVDVFLIQMEIEREHSYNRVTLEMAFHRRREAVLTIITSRETLSGLYHKYPAISLFSDGRRCHEISLGDIVL